MNPHELDDWSDEDILCVQLFLVSLEKLGLDAINAWNECISAYMRSWPKA
jgi:hypothetical protein